MSQVFFALFIPCDRPVFEWPWTRTISRQNLLRSAEDAAGHNYKFVCIMINGRQRLIRSFILTHYKEVENVNAPN